MTDKLPSNLLKLFAPRPPIPYLPPLDRDEILRTGPVISGLARFTQPIGTHDKDYVPTESLLERRSRKLREREEKHKAKFQEQSEKWNPTEDPNVSGDPFKTLIIGRLNYSVTESELRRELEIYGLIKSVRIVKDKNTGKPRGYAFVEFEREKDMKAAYHEADASKIDGRRVVVDVERGRSVKGWKPRRLGGGLGFTRKGPEEQNQRHSGRETASRSRDFEPSRARDYGRMSLERPRERRRSRSPGLYRPRERDERPRERDDRYRDRGYDRHYDRDDRHREREYERHRERDYDRPREYNHFRR